MGQLPIQIYDIVVVVIVAVATINGAIKGLAWQIAWIGSLVLSSWVAIRYYEKIVPMLPESDPWNRYAAMLLLFVLCSLGVWIVFNWISHIINRIHLQEFDRQMGALFGLAKGLLICMIITFFAVSLSESTRQLALKSHSGYWLAVCVRRIVPAIPAEVRRSFGRLIDEFDRQLQDATPPGHKDADNA